MIYLAYEALRRGTRPLSWMLETGQKMAQAPGNPLHDTIGMRALATAFELPARALKDYGKPGYQIWEELEHQEFTVEPEVVASLPFANLLRFNKDTGEARPKVLIAAALSGHHATLLQGTIRTFVQDFDTYITDWKDARQVPLEEGEFGFDEYVDHLLESIKILGPGTHVVATCQAAPPAMVATAVLAKSDPDLLPASLTLMGGPVDTRVSPNTINKATQVLPLGLFEKGNIQTVPPGFPGAGRKVYPGFYQLTGFMLLNPAPHLKQYKSFVKNALAGDEEALAKFRDFYDEYFAVLDMDAKFYIETLQKVFFEHQIPTGKIEFHGEKVDFDAVDQVPLLTVEGANDHLCPPGQTEAAHDVMRKIPVKMRKNYIQPGVGHYGVFSGSKFQSGIYPVIRDFVWQAVDGKHHEPGKMEAKGHKRDPEAVQTADIPV